MVIKVKWGCVILKCDTLCLVLKLVSKVTSRVIFEDSKPFVNSISGLKKIVNLKGLISLNWS